MNLCRELRKISDKQELNEKLKLRVTCNEKSLFTNSKVVIGNYAGYTQAVDNVPEIAQIELSIPEYKKGFVTILETEIEKIEVI